MQPNKLRATWPFQALADDTRLRVVRLLSSTGLEASPGQLAMTLEIPPSHLSRHLQILVWADLISLRRQGRSSVVAISRAQSSYDTLCSAVLSMPDEVGIFARDLENFLATAGNKSFPYSEES